MNEKAQSKTEITSKVVETVAGAAGVDPLELNPPLFAVINPDALEAVYESASEQFKVEFEYAGYLVTISGDGTVTATEPGDAETPTVLTELNR